MALEVCDANQHTFVARSPHGAQTPNAAPSFHAPYTFRTEEPPTLSLRRNNRAPLREPRWEDVRPHLHAVRLRRPPRRVVLHHPSVATTATPTADLDVRFETADPEGRGCLSRGRPRVHRAAPRPHKRGGRGDAVRRAARPHLRRPAGPPPTAHLREYIPFDATGLEAPAGELRGGGAHATTGRTRRAVERAAAGV